MSPSSTSPAALDEPTTPAWLPALGAALFVVVCVVWALWPGEPSDAARPPPAEIGGAAAAAK